MEEAKPVFYEPNDEDRKILERARERFTESMERWDENRKELADDLDFYAGNQWPSTIQRDREIEGRPCLVVNRFPQFIRQVCNDQRQNRPSIKVRPVDDDADPDTAEIFQGLIRHIEANSNADLAYDTAFFYAVAGGFGFFRIVTDYVQSSFDQEIFIKPIEMPLSVYPDADSISADGSDWKYCFIVDEMPRRKFEDTYGDQVPPGWDQGDGLDEGAWCDKDTVRVAEYFEIVPRKTKLIRTVDGSTYTLEDYNELAEKPEIDEERDATLPSVKWYLLAGNYILDRKDWAGSYIPVVPVFGDTIMVNGKRQLLSLLRFSKDAQRMINYARSVQAEVEALQPKSPFIMAEGQDEGFEGMWENANRINFSSLKYKPVTLNGQLAPPPQRQGYVGAPAGVMQLGGIAEQDLMSTSGIHEAGLGMRSNETSGAAIMARQREGDVATFHFIDNMTRAIRYAGQILVDLIPKIYDRPARVVRVLGDDGSEKLRKVNVPVELKGEELDEIGRIYDLTVGQYDVVCTAGPSYTSKRAEGAAFLERAVGANPKLMEIAGDLLFKIMDMPYAEEIAERLQKVMPPELRPEKEGDEEGPQIPPEVQQQMQAAQQQIEQMGQAMQQMQAELQSKQAEEAQAAAKLQIEQEKVAIDRYNAETQRLKVEGELALKANDDLTESEREQFKADLALRLKELDQDHQLEMELLKKQITPPPTDTGQIMVQRDPEGAVVSVNGRPVIRDEAGNIVGLQ